MAVDQVDSTANWMRELDNWKSIPALSPVWEDVDGFVQALREVAASKIAERDSGRNALRDALVELVHHHSDDLEYFEARADSWNAEAADRTEAKSVAEQVFALAQELNSRRDLLNQRPSHYAEARRVREEISAREDAIYRHIESLAKRFGSDQSDVKNSVPQDRAVVRDEKQEEPVNANDDQPDPSTHRLVNRDNHRYSPMSRAQETAILHAGPGVGLVFASSAFGFEQLMESVQHLAATAPDGPIAYGAMPPALVGEKESSKWIGDFVKANEEAKRLLACQIIAIGSPDIADRIQGAVQFTKELGRDSLRYLFFVAPGGVWSWLTAPQSEREALARELRPVFGLEPWSVAAVRDRLEREGKLHEPRIAEKVVEATGGWAWCLDKLFEMCGKESDPSPAADKLTERLMPNGDLHQELIMRTGARPDTIAQRALDHVSAAGAVTVDQLDPSEIGASSIEEIRAAVRFLELMGCVSRAEGKARLVPFLARVQGSLPAS